MTLRSQLAQLDSLVCRPAVREPRSRGTLRQGGIIIRLPEGGCLPPQKVRVSRGRKGASFRRPSQRRVARGLAANGYGVALETQKTSVARVLLFQTPVLQRCSTLCSLAWSARPLLPSAPRRSTLPQLRSTPWIISGPWWRSAVPARVMTGTVILTAAGAAPTTSTSTGRPCLPRQAPTRL